jgi:hypothetical protein
LTARFRAAGIDGSCCVTSSDCSERTRTERRRVLVQMAADIEDDDLYEITLDSRPSR